MPDPETPDPPDPESPSPEAGEAGGGSCASSEAPPETEEAACGEPAQEPEPAAGQDAAEAPAPVADDRRPEPEEEIVSEVSPGRQEETGDAAEPPGRPSTARRQAAEPEAPRPSPRPAGAPLDGVLVVDLSRLLPGPLVSRLLADLGARVVKVEEPRHGDPVRMAPPLKGSTGALAALLLSGVESLALDLKQETAREVLHDLLSRADVMLESFRPGTLARLGLPPEELRERHPHLVVASLSGFGQDGPRAARAGHDLTYQALAGTLAPTVRMPAVPVADLAGAWSTALAVVAALHQRDRQGGTAEGTRVDASLYDAALHANLTNWSGEASGPRAVGERLALSGALPCYNLYATADGGFVALACLEPHFWKRFCEVVERDDLVKKQFDTAPAVRRRVQKLMGSRTRAQWADLGERHDLPLEPVLSAEEARDDPQARHRRVVGLGPDGLLRLAYPALLDGHRPESGEHFPRLGEDTDALLEELGRDLTRGEKRAAGVGQRGRWKRRLARWVAKRKGPEA